MGLNASELARTGLNELEDVLSVSNLLTLDQINFELDHNWSNVHTHIT